MCSAQQLRWIRPERTTSTEVGTNDWHERHTEGGPKIVDAALKRLDKLVGTWELTGDAVGTVRYEWMKGGSFLLQHVDMELFGHQTKGFEVIGRLLASVVTNRARTSIHSSTAPRARRSTTCMR